MTRRSWQGIMAQRRNGGNRRLDRIDIGGVSGWIEAILQYTEQSSEDTHYESQVQANQSKEYSATCRDGPEFGLESAQSNRTDLFLRFPDGHSICSAPEWGKGCSSRRSAASFQTVIPALRKLDLGLGIPLTPRLGRGHGANATGVSPRSLSSEEHMLRCESSAYSSRSHDRRPSHIKTAVKPGLKEAG